jgi:hypothetical protein
VSLATALPSLQSRKTRPIPAIRFATLYPMWMALARAEAFLVVIRLAAELVVAENDTQFRTK